MRRAASTSVRRSLRRHAARGVLINGAFTTGLTFLGFARGFIVAALLTTAEFGVWGILATTVAMLTILKPSGVGDKYLQQDEDNMWAMPFGLSLTLFAPDLAQFVIGGTWEPAVLLLQVFGAIAALGHLGFNWQAYYRARGTTAPVAIVSVLVAALFLVIAVPLTFSDGLSGLATGLSIAVAGGLVARVGYIVRLFPGRPLAGQAARSLAPSVPAIGIVVLARLLETGERTPAMATAELAAYLLVTAVATWLVERELIREALGYLRVGGRPASTARA